MRDEVSDGPVNRCHNTAWQLAALVITESTRDVYLSKKATIYACLLKNIYIRADE